MNNNERSGWIVIGISLGLILVGLLVVAALFVRNHRLPENVRCQANLRLLELAKAEWAQKSSKTNGSPVTLDDLLPLIANTNLTTCPGGGTYALGAIGEPSQCSIHGR